MFPSCAVLFDYAEADVSARLLRSAGYRTAHAATLDGFPATIESIANSQPYAVRFHNRERYFKARRNDKIVYSEAVQLALPMTRDAAYEIVQRLIDIGYTDAEAFVHRYRIQAVKDELIEAWGPDENAPVAEVDKRRDGKVYMSDRTSFTNLIPAPGWRALCCYQNAQGSLVYCVINRHKLYFLIWEFLPG